MDALLSVMNNSQIKDTWRLVNARTSALYLNCLLHHNIKLFERTILAYKLND